MTRRHNKGNTTDFKMEQDGTRRTRLTDDRWTRRMTEWILVGNRRKRARQLLRWPEELKSVGSTNWSRTTQDKKL